MDYIPSILLEDVANLKKGKPTKKNSFMEKTSNSVFKTDLARKQTSAAPRKSKCPQEKVGSPQSVTSTKLMENNPKISIVENRKSKPNDVRAVLQSSHVKKDFNHIISKMSDIEELNYNEQNLSNEDVNVSTQSESIDSAVQSKILTSRKEVAYLKNAMKELLETIGVNDDKAYPTEMHIFMEIIKEEQQIYDKVMQELIRQVTVNMIERGELLAEVRRRYSNMFSKIPDHIHNLHTELVAHRKLNRRLSEELFRAQEHICEMTTQLDFVKKHDAMVNDQAQLAQEKLVQMINNAENTEESMEEFHELYKMQRARIEKQLRQADKEKRLWVDASTHLAMRISKEYGISDLLLLQKHEEGRLRITNHMVINISDTNANDLRNVEQKIDEWRTKLFNVSKSIVDEDFSNIELLSKLQRQMRKVQKNLITNEPQNEIELGHKLLTEFHILDVHSLTEHLQFWTTELNEVTTRFTSGRDLKIREEIATSRRLTTGWVEIALRLLGRNQDSSNGEEYLPLTKALKSLQDDIFEWSNKLETRASGEDGLTSLIIMIQSQIEDRLTLMNGKGMNKPLNPQDRQSTIEALTLMNEQTGILINTLSNTAEREQHKIPLQVESWIARVLEQMNVDMDNRNEDNINLHTSLVSWMVNLLLPSRNVEESSETQFAHLTKELQQFNATLLRDTADMEMITDDKRDMRKLLM